LKYYLISATVLVFDQLTKLFVKGFSLPFLGLSSEGLQYGERNTVIHNVLNITFIENPGIAFGLYFGDLFKLILTSATLVASAILAYYLYYVRERSTAYKVSVALILGGAIGNLIDRMFYGVLYNYAPLFYGSVVDFIEVSFFNVYIFNRVIGNYVFNFADASVASGILLLFFAVREFSRKTAEAAPSLEQQ
jgi:signal peptidase II